VPRPGNKPKTKKPATKVPSQKVKTDAVTVRDEQSNGLVSTDKQAFLKRKAQKNAINKQTDDRNKLELLEIKFHRLERRLASLEGGK